MNLYIIRHATAEKRNPKRFPDDDSRPLTRRGAKSFLKAAAGLKALGVKPDVIVTSPVPRAGETAMILRKTLGRANLREALELRYDTDPEKAREWLSRQLKRLPKGEIGGGVALVGHEPWLGEFIGILLAGKTGPAFPLKKGACCMLEWPGSGKGNAKLLWSMTAKQLAAME